MDYKLRVPDSIPESENSIPFHQGMADRMSVSFHKYGPVAEGYPDKVNAIESMLVRLAMYEGPERFRALIERMPEIAAIAAAKDPIGRNIGNTELHMDAGNFFMIDFMHPAHPKAHYVATDSRESPGRVWQPDEFDGSVETSQRANDLSA